MKYFYIILAVFILTLIVVVFWLKSIWSKISFNYKIKNFKVGELFKGKLGFVLDLLIKNGSGTSIRISSIHIELYYKGTLISKTPKVIGENIIKSNSETTIKDFNLDLYLNKESGEVITRFVKKEPITFEFKVKLRLFGIPFSIPKQLYTYNEYEQ